MGVNSLVFVLLFITLCSSSVAMSLLWEERADCLVLIDFLVPCDCKCSVTLPRGAVGWSAVWDCGIC